MAQILHKLSGGDRRSIGQVDEVIADVEEDQSLFDELVLGMLHGDPLIAMRAADAVEKLTREHPDWLRPYKDFLIDRAPLSEGQEVCWSLALMFGRLQLSDSERHRILDILSGWLDQKSSILKTFAMQGLADQAEQNPELLPDVLPVIEESTATGTPAMRARGRKLLKKLRVIEPTIAIRKGRRES